MASNLIVKGLTQRFGGLTALNRVDIEVHEREIVGVIGPNGAGKTTLFNIITGVYKPTAGEIFLDNIRIDGKNHMRLQGWDLLEHFRTFAYLSRFQ